MRLTNLDRYILKTTWRKPRPLIRLACKVAWLAGRKHPLKRICAVAATFAAALNSIDRLAKAGLLAEDRDLLGSAPTPAGSILNMEVPEYSKVLTVTPKGVQRLAA